MWWYLLLTSALGRWRRQIPEALWTFSVDLWWVSGQWKTLPQKSKVDSISWRTTPEVVHWPSHTWSQSCTHILHTWICKMYTHMRKQSKRGKSVDGFHCMRIKSKLPIRSCAMLSWGWSSPSGSGLSTLPIHPTSRPCETSHTVFIWDLASCESQPWWCFLPHLPGLTLWWSVKIYSSVPSLETQPPSPCHLLSPQPALLSSSHPSAVCYILSITIGREPGHVQPAQIFFFCLKSGVSPHATEPGMFAFLI